MTDQTSDPFQLVTNIGASIVLYQNEVSEVQSVIDSFFSTTPKLGSRDLNLKLMLVDNSPDDRLKSLARGDPRIEYVKSIENRGYGAGHNQAITNLEFWSTYHVVLNPDIRFASNILSHLLMRMEQETDIGLLMPKITYPDGSLQFAARLLPTPVNLILRRFPFLKKLTNNSNTVYELQKAKLDQAMEIPFLSGCFMLMRTDVLRSVGKFDERFFMYMEDSDLSRRIGDVSRTVYDPSVSIVHIHQKGSFKNRRLMRIHIQSALRYFNKWGWFFDRVRRERNAIAITRYLPPAP